MEFLAWIIALKSLYAGIGAEWIYEGLDHDAYRHYFDSGYTAKETLFEKLTYF